MVQFPTRSADGNVARRSANVCQSAAEVRVYQPRNGTSAFGWTAQNWRRRRSDTTHIGPPLGIGIVFDFCELIKGGPIRIRPSRWGDASPTAIHTLTRHPALPPEPLV